MEAVAIYAACTSRDVSPDYSIATCDTADTAQMLRYYTATTTRPRNLDNHATTQRLLSTLRLWDVPMMSGKALAEAVTWSSGTAPAPAANATRAGAGADYIYFITTGLARASSSRGEDPTPEHLWILHALHLVELTRP